MPYTHNGFVFNDDGTLKVAGAGTDPFVGLNGMIVAPQPPCSAAPGAVVAGITYFTRFVATRSMTITKMQVEVTAADGSSPVSGVGIMDVAGNRLGSSGDVAGKLNAVGKPIYTLSAGVALVAGTAYYSAFSSGASITPAQLVQVVNYPADFESVVGQMSTAYANAAAVPATMAGALTTPNGILLIARES